MSLIKYGYTSSTAFHGGSYYYYIPATLKTVTITNATAIPEEAFFNCVNLASVTLNNAVTSIGTNAFKGCTGLTTANIGTGLTSIASYAFYGDSSLTSITVPYEVKTIASYAFSNCSSLTINCQIEEQPNTWNSNWNSSNRPVVWEYGVEKGESVEGLQWLSVDGETIRIVGYTGSATTLAIPSSINEKNVEVISQNAFSGNTTLTSVIIPDSILNIETNAFANITTLLTVEIPNSVIQIQENAFVGCTNISALCKNASKPSGWVSSWIPTNAPIVWNYTGTKGVTADGFKWATVSGIAQNAFRGKTAVTSVYIPASITFIGANAFTGCTNATFSCEAASKPSGWASTWKDSANTVYWSM